MLVYASISDYKTREVSNWLWLIFCPLGLALNLYEGIFLNTGDYLFVFGFSLAVSLVLSVTLFYLGLYGGADAKAFIAISLTTPQSPRFIDPYLGFTSPIFPLSVFFNSVTIAAFYSLVIFSRNLSRLLGKKKLFTGLEGEPLWKKALAMISCVKVDVGSLRGPPFEYLAERITLTKDRTTRELLISPKVPEDKETNVAQLREWAAKGELPQELWVSPTLPLITFITLGFLASIFLGDAMLWLIAHILLIAA